MRGGQQREVLRKKVLQIQKNEFDKLRNNIDNIINNRLTSCKNIVDFPKVKEYLDIVFNKFDLTKVTIYISPAKVMNDNDFGKCYGCYIPALNLVLIKDTSSKTKDTATSKFQKLLKKAVTSNIDIEDVVVHELIHAISYNVCRSGNNKFVFDEEEFAYTNCVDFYKRKGMTNDEIVSGIFLPFCTNDVMKDYKQMRKIWDFIGQRMPGKKDCGELVYKKFEQNAHALSDKIIEVAKERAHNMIDLYNKYGRKMVHTNLSPNDDVSLRIKSLDMECDF